MRKYIWISIFFSLLTGFAAQADVPVKLVTNRHGATQLNVGGKPFIMIAGELHNSSNSTTTYMNSLWKPLQSLHLNTVLATIAWEQFEPEEGTFDYTLVDNLVSGARQSGLKVVILWFASWKNGQSSYAPVWVKKDTRRFRRALDVDGKETETLTPFCEATMKADARAYKALMQHLKEVDGQEGTVIAMQPENEVGLFQDMDYSPASKQAFRQEVPPALLAYMKQHRDRLRPELRSVWEDHGARTSGTWQQVFGVNAWSKSFYTTWQYATYIDHIAAEGKSVYPIPVFCNCWIVQKDEEMPGAYPNGGPVSRVMDIWKAAAPHVDILAPDIYLPDFKGITADYHRADNPLLIPEAVVNPGNAFWAFGEGDALCYSPFGIEDVAGNYVFSQSYKVLNELMPLITAYQGSDRMIGILKTKGEDERTVTMGAYRLHITYMSDDAYGLIIQTAPDEFVMAGLNFRVRVSATDPKKTAGLLQTWEGGYEGERWIPTRLLNGDEGGFHIEARGRRTLTGELTNSYDADHTTEVFTYNPAARKAIFTPGIYRVTAYLR